VAQQDLPGALFWPAIAKNISVEKIAVLKKTAKMSCKDLGAPAHTS
jgi:hypothetical protein